MPRIRRKKLTKILLVISCLSLHTSVTAVSASSLSKVDSHAVFSTNIPSPAKEPDLLQGLAQKSSTSSKKKKFNDDPYGIGSFLLGCLLIPFALVLLWKNEKKVVTFARCMTLGQEQVKSIGSEEPAEAQ